jgi:hypothetical protein
MVSRSFTTHAIAFHDDDGNHTFTSAVLLDSFIASNLPSRLPSRSHLTPSPSPYEIKDAGPDKGFGMFATRHIPAGALILVEHPAIVTPAALPPATDAEERVSLYHALSQHLRLEDREELQTMANCRTVEQCPTVEEGVAWTNGTAVSLPLPPAIDVNEASDPKTREYGATFLKICRANHRYVKSTYSPCSPSDFLSVAVPTLL